MRKLILEIHRYFYGMNAKYQLKKNNKVLWILCNIIFQTCETILTIYLNVYRILKIYPSKLPEQSNIIVSLTSFPKRINDVWIVIDSIFHQKLLPRKIILYLTEEEFPEQKKELPTRLLKYEKLGLEICFRKYNLKPHNKYFYALQEYKDCCVITIDDDIYYHDNLLSNLYNLHCQYPACVCANTIDIITFNQNGEFSPYNTWKRPNSSQEPSLYNLALGYNGVLYPPHVFSSNGVFNIENIKLLSLNADDLWLKAHQIKGNIRVVCGNFFCSGILIGGSQATSLMSTNCGNNENDIQWKNLCTFYKITKESFK